MRQLINYIILSEHRISTGIHAMSTVIACICDCMLRYSYFVDQQGLRDTQCIVFIHNKQGSADFHNPSLSNHFICILYCSSAGSPKI